MKFNDLMKTLLSNDIVCIMDNVINGRIIEEPDAAYRFIDGKYADKYIDRITLLRRTDGVKGYMMGVSLRLHKGA